MPSIFLRFKRKNPKIDPRLLLVLVIAMLIFAPGFTLLRPKQVPPAASPLLTAVPTPTEEKTDTIRGTPTPFPPEYLTNEEQTLGPTFAAVLLVLVVVAGVLSHSIRHRRDD